ncbi:hypothetical protein FPV67DRAFT_585215 [Lyophyllum atratum]|nr:hypothetical protein FPV67DRAFT_585215 [Lyophyllum atratum]
MVHSSEFTQVFGLLYPCVVYAQRRGHILGSFLLLTHAGTKNKVLAIPELEAPLKRWGNFCLSNQGTATAFVGPAWHLTTQRLPSIWSKTWTRHENDHNSCQPENNTRVDPVSLPIKPSRDNVQCPIKAASRAYASIMPTFRVAPFPQELVDMIIDEDPDDLETLKTFALVSKTCLPQARKHLFSLVHFLTAASNPTIARESHARFRSILSRDPRVGTYVRELFVRDTVSDPSDDRESWIRDDPSFHQTLRTLAAGGLERFTLETELRWTSFPPGFKQALMGAFTAPSLQFLDLRGLRSLPKSCCIAFGAQVSDLSLVHVELTEEGDADLPEELPSGGAYKLWWLGIEDVSGSSIRILFNALLPASTVEAGRILPSLTALHIGPGDADAVEALWEVTQAGRETIKYFNWEYSHKSASGTVHTLFPSDRELIETYYLTRRAPVPPIHTPPLNLRILENLFAITFEVKAYPDDSEDVPDDPDQFRGLLHLLGSVKPENTIQDLYIRVNYHNFTDARDSVMDYDGWARLDTLLDSTAFADLRRVTVELDLVTILSQEEAEEDSDEESIDVEDREEELENFLRSRLPKLVDADLLTYDLKIRGRKP